MPVASELVSKPNTYRARRLNRNRQPQVKGGAAKIVFLEPLPGVSDVENVGRRCESADGENELPTETKIPIDYIRGAIAASNTPARGGRHQERTLWQAS